MNTRTSSKTENPKAKAPVLKLPALPVIRTASGCGDSSCGCGCGLPISKS